MKFQLKQNPDVTIYHSSASMIAGLYQECDSRGEINSDRQHLVFIQSNGKIWAFNLAQGSLFFCDPSYPLVRLPEGYQLTITP